MKSSGQISMMMLRARLSRIIAPTPISIASVSATVAHTGRRMAARNPNTMARMSNTELITLSP